MAKLSPRFEVSIAIKAAVVERSRQIRCAKVIALSKALSVDLVALDIKNQAIIRSAQQANEKSVNAIERSVDINQTIDFLRLASFRM
jgi:hypothetical protein